MLRQCQRVAPRDFTTFGLQLPNGRELIVEVLSPSSRQNDLTYKRELYESQGVRSYLIADPDAKTIEQLTLSPARKYEPIDVSSTIKMSVCDDCEIEVELKKIFSS